MNPPRRPRYQLWGVYYGPCHQIPPHEDGSVRNKFYVVVRVCSEAGQVYCALINSNQANLPGIHDCQLPIAPGDIAYESATGLRLINPQSWLSVHTSQSGGRLLALPPYVPEDHELVGRLDKGVVQEIFAIIQRCKNISRIHKAMLLGDADC